MQRVGTQVVHSASDLNNFLACEHLVALDRRAALGELQRPAADNPQADILRRLGEEHEAEYLRRLAAGGAGVVRIERAAGSDASANAAATVEAMRAGADIIYQAAFFDEGWIGYADFLRRVPGASELGDFHYEVEDTKLARHTEPYFLLQLCYYSEHVGRIQGREPAQMHVILGDGKRESFSVAEFAAHYRAVKVRFTAATQGEPLTAPYPVKHCDLCVWQTRCSDELDEADHLSRVARISRLQVNRLESAGVPTLAGLAQTSDAAKPATMASRTWERLREQAQLQDLQRRAIAAREPDPYKYRVLPAEANDPRKRGFALLPPRATGDVFFDMEGDPFVTDGDRWFGGPVGLEYLFGVHAAGEGFTAFWGCDRSSESIPRHRAAERRAFAQFMSYLMDRRARFPDFHVYHYAPYEVTAIKKLSQRHGIFEEEATLLLSEERFVDLYRVVSQSILVGQPHYGIKYLEPFYETRVRTGVKKGDDSIVEFERWLVLRAAGSPADEILADIEQYNRFDCESTLHLLEWLTALRDAHPESSTPYVAPEPRELAQSTAAQRDEVAAVRERLLAAVPPGLDPADLAMQSEHTRAAWLLSECLAYSDREAKPLWWDYFAACEAFDDDPHNLIERDSSSLSGLTHTQTLDDGTLEFSFPEQHHKVKAGSAYHDPATRASAGTVRAIDDAARVLRLKPPKAGLTNPPRALVAPVEDRNRLLVPSLLRTARAFAGAGANAVPHSAAYDILLKRDSRIAGLARDGTIQPVEPTATQILPLLQGLDSSYLFVQGPPGSGKTQVAAELIVALVTQGYRVGIAAPSHSAAHNLLDRVERVAVARDLSFEAAHRYGDEDQKYVSSVTGGFVRSLKKVEDRTGTERLLSGTAWFYAHEAMADSLDYLFIDEAGQMAIPTVVAMTPSMRNLVLLGDPAQLAQISRATHRGDLGLSVLDYLLGDDVTIPPNRGVFLTTTWRMHGDICRFVSEISYQGRLRSAPACAVQRVESAGLSGAGLRFLSVDHSGNRSRSIEEAERIAGEIGLLLAGAVIDKDGARRRLVPDDIIVVAPYNAQRVLLERVILERTGAAVDVGTVNKFQGREAYVVFYSMATSSGADMPRTTEFLFERNRLNVAVSRARALAVLVCAPALLEVSTPSVDAMRMVNGLDRFLELARTDRT
jgi:uncharacterized protein